jgi:hypothetical protein
MKFAAAFVVLAAVCVSAVASPLVGAYSALIYAASDPFNLLFTQQKRMFRRETSTAALAAAWYVMPVVAGGGAISNFALAAA